MECNFVLGAIIETSLGIWNNAEKSYKNDILMRIF